MATRSIARPGASPPAPSPHAMAGFALFNLGFRPFYFVAATYAALSIPLWVLVWAGLVPMRVSIATQWWHTHEMVFGFALAVVIGFLFTAARAWTDRKSTRLNSSHVKISYAVFCLKKKKKRTGIECMSLL